MITKKLILKNDNPDIEKTIKIKLNKNNQI